MFNTLTGFAVNIANITPNSLVAARHVEQHPVEPPDATAVLDIPHGPRNYTLVENWQRMIAQAESYYWNGCAFIYNLSFAFSMDRDA